MMSRLRRSIQNAMRRDVAKQHGLPWALGVDRLYKFKGFAGEQRCHVEDLLTNARIYFASPEQFNDPYDVAPVLRLGGDPSDAAFVAELEAQEQADLIASGCTPAEIDALRQAEGTGIDGLAEAALADLRRSLRSQLRILCLTAEQCHPLQWSHYADQHRGLCLHFECGPGTTFGVARQVAYRAERSPILLPLKRQTTDAIVERMALVKANFWAYEREFRIVAGPGLESVLPLCDNYAAFPTGALAGITVGMRMGDSERRQLVDLVDAHHPRLPIWTCVEDRERFWMRVERLR